MNIPRVNQIRAAARALWQSRNGATAIEYGLIVALIVLALVGGLQSFATSSNQMYAKISSAVTAVLTP